MKPLWAGVLSCLGVLLLGGCDSHLEEYVSEKGGFKVKAPGKLQETPQSGWEKPLTIEKLVVGEKTYAIGYVDDLAGSAEPGEKSNTRLLAAQNGALNKVKAKLIREKDKEIFLNNKYPGREFIGELPEKMGRLRERIFLVDRRLFQILVIGEQTWVESKEVDRFLDSFAMLK
jgi:hypothetical protein